jgi:hypothetical protein
LLSADTHWQEEVSAGLTIQDNYGVEIDRFNSSYVFVDTQVTVPEISIPLNDRQLQFINGRFNPLQTSDYNGIDVYIAVKSIYIMK